ncbi:MAG: transcriptional regulator [Deltaproteobacteria bacterium]|nr:transcriptional regulator [Deltaproteobacteria bacterium]
MAKVIKRYGNRKLYDLDSSTYVTLHEIAEMVKRGEDIQVIDNRTKEDLTAVTLTQIILEEEKARHSVLPLTFLKRIIQQSGESLSELVARVNPQGALMPLKDALEETEKGILKLFERGEITLDEAREVVREIFAAPRRGVEDFQKKFDERMRFALEKVTGVSSLHGQVRELEKKIAELESELARKSRADSTRARRRRAQAAAAANDEKVA